MAYAETVPASSRVKRPSVAAARASRAAAAALKVADADTRDDEQLTKRQIGHQAGLARIARAKETLSQALDQPHASTWDYVAAKYAAAREAADVCSDVYCDAEWDDADIVSGVSAEVYDLLSRTVNEDLVEEPAPHWQAVALKAGALLGEYYEGLPMRWATWAEKLVASAEALGSGPAEDLDSLEVLEARGRAERMLYHLAHDRNGYAAWACFGGVSVVAALAESIVQDTRRLAKATKAQAALSCAVVNAVWFDLMPGDERRSALPECAANHASDEFSNALRQLEAFEAAGDQKGAAAAIAEMDAAEEAGLAEQPKTRSGVAFQLLVAAGDLDVVRSGRTEELKEKYEQRVRTTIVNTIKALGLPFDYQTATFYLGDLLTGLDGRDRPEAMPGRGAKA